jgi:hypothetical protein
MPAYKTFHPCIRCGSVAVKTAPHLCLQPRCRQYVEVLSDCLYTNPAGVFMV